MVETQIKMLFLDSIRESPLNPRKNFFNLEELAEDFKKRGILQPLMVRPKNQHYELIFGARRFRASKIAGLQQVPAIVREMDDNDALETMIVENGKRDDVHELEEAAGYKMLRDRGYEVSAIAAKVSKDESYVYKRLKLLDLIKPIQAAFLEGRINAGHAMHIARLPGDAQKQAFEMLFTDRWGYKQSGKDLEARSVKDLEIWIKEHILLDLHSVPFKKDDASLIPAAGSCMNCSYRTGFIPQLFSDLAKKDTCTHPTCFQAKLMEHTTRLVEANPSYARVTLDYNRTAANKTVLPQSEYHLIETKKDRCQLMQKAIVIEGHSQCGHVVEICADPKCPSHAGRKHTQSAEDMKWKEKQRLEDLKRKKTREIRSRILRAALAELRVPLERNDLEMIISGLWTMCGDDNLKAIEAGNKWERIKGQYGGVDHRAMLTKNLPNLDEAGLARLLMEMALIRDLNGIPDYAEDKFDRLLAFARNNGIDSKSIEKQVEAEFATAEVRRKEREKKTKKAKAGQKNARGAKV
jgi:ParB family transcriptional regulator, chromosome partitioning protein